ncbi:MAG TPA: hypothetical protein VF720_02675 [Candidatus Eisenbacteria bacterium]
MTMAIRHARTSTNPKTSAKKAAPATVRARKNKADQPPDGGNDERAIARKNAKPRSSRQANRGA